MPLSLLHFEDFLLFVDSFPLSLNSFIPPGLKPFLPRISLLRTRSRELISDPRTVPLIDRFGGPHSQRKSLITKSYPNNIVLRSHHTLASKPSTVDPTDLLVENLPMPLFLSLPPYFHLSSPISLTHCGTLTPL